MPQVFPLYPYNKKKEVKILANPSFTNYPIVGVVQSEKITTGKIYQFLTGDGNFHDITFGTNFSVCYIPRTRTDLSCPD